MVDQIPLDHIPESKREMLSKLVEQLSAIDGMASIVLGGSHASGTQRADSDLDMGLYYFEDRPFSIDEIRRVAADVSAQGMPTVTGFYEWGAWVNGGAWIHTQQGKVDFLYRNVNHIQRTIAEAQQGIAHHDYDQQPAYGFYSVIYLAETQICIPLYDPGGIIARLKNQVEKYPGLLKIAIIQHSLWAAEFTLLHGRGFAAQGDIYNTAGCLTRAASNLTQALFALNERYFLRDKQVMKQVATFSNLPPGYIEQIEAILAYPGNTEATLRQSVSVLERVWEGVVALPGVQYEPKFTL